MNMISNDLKPKKNRLTEEIKQCQRNLVLIVKIALFISTSVLLKAINLQIQFSIFLTIFLMITLKALHWIPVSYLIPQFKINSKLGPITQEFFIKNEHFSIDRVRVAGGGLLVFVKKPYLYLI